MAESMQGLHRSHRCTEVSNANIGEKVTVMGWVQKRRNLGSLIFVDLRDRSGILQIVFGEENVGAEGFEKAGTLRSEFVIAVEGTVQKRTAAVNENLKTGDIEVIATSIRVLSEAQTPPFQIEENSKTSEDIRLKYRYLDLRRPDIQRNLMLRSNVLRVMRDFMANEGFLEIETPILCKSTPEGARDYLVPSRIHHGHFYALPQSPQLFKQLLMASGYDRYFQIARCFRDEDLRADRQPEFTQADMELSFVDIDDVIEVNERLLKHLFKEVVNVDVEIPFKRMPWQEAMDYLVPSRIHHGHFYALPQSPQLFKQLLMASGYDRYFQIARCFRDEDLRADRQPEFTQADMELSFVDIDDVIEVNERLLKHLFKEVVNVDVEIPFKRMPWQEAMDRFGSDKPDTRFGMELCDVSDVVKDCGFGVFTGALENGGSVRGINVEGQAKMPRKKIDKLVEHAKGCGAKGLAYLCINEDGTYKSSFAKFMTEAELDALVARMNGKPGDLLLFAADKNKIVWNVLGALRLMLGAELGLIDENKYNFLWVTEFPLLEWSDEENRFMAMHHPFTMPMEEDWDKIDSDPGAVRAKAYDIVLNGTELGGGSVRIHQDDIQEKMFEVLGFTKERAHEQFGFLLDAFSYGVPPHAGLAFGVDRICMHMLHTDNIKEVIAFPKVKDASDLMSEAPGTVDPKQLEELGIAVAAEEDEE